MKEIRCILFWNEGIKVKYVYFKFTVVVRLFVRFAVCMKILAFLRFL